MHAPFRAAPLRLLASLLLLFLTLLASRGEACQDAARPLGEHEQRRLLDASEMRFLRDRSRALTIDEVASPARQQDFLPVKGDLSFGFTRDAVWVRLCVRQQSTADAEWRLASRAPYLDDVRLYTRKGDESGWAELRSGDLVAVNDRPLPYRSALFPLHFKADQPQEIYLRLRSTTSLSTALTLHRADAFRVQAGRDLVGIGIWLGLGIMLSAVNLINWFWTGQRLYLGFACYVTVIWAGLSFGYGVAGAYVFPDNALVSHYLTRTLNCIFIGGTIALIRTPLRLAEHFPRINRALPYIAGFVASFALSIPFDRYVDLIPFAQAFQIMFLLIGCIATWRNMRMGHKGASWMMAAFLCFAIPRLIHLTRALGLFSWNSDIETVAPSLIAYGVFLHFAILSQLREEQQARAAAMAASDAQHRLAEQEERLRSEQSLFFAFAAHELRSPLGVILTGLGNLKRSPQADEATRTHRLTRLTHAAQRMNRLIDRHLRFQRMGQPGFEPNLEREPADLPALRALQGSRAQHAARVIEHSIEGRQSLEVMMDAELVTLAISNLLDNAAKYSDEHTPIRFELESTDTEVRYRVFNHGRALPRELAEGNFRVFRRSASSERSQAGFGIGLALADHVARAHGGRLDCSHQAGTTCFTLSIPLTPPASGEASG